MKYAKMSLFIPVVLSSDSGTAGLEAIDITSYSACFICSQGLLVNEQDATSCS